ncbi:MAG: aspartate-semialdehyde dehydrogenase [Synergistaceae bacterium]|jgi:aspartate-semialdehyde dehydrogenase|nr:aspartate-semialdehyde dehydrogenase [Synergistaceae bacterium]
MSGANVAVFGATGAVGVEMLKILEERNFPVENLRLLASRGERTVRWRGGDYAVEAIGPAGFEGVDVALFAVEGDVSREWAPVAVKSGAVVIDNSSAFRMAPEVPLVVPEVNPEDIATHRGIIANPNCSTIIAVVALDPLHRAAGIRRLIASTYQAVSGAGRQGVEELEKQTRAYAEGNINPEVSAFQYQIAFNLIPHIDAFAEGDYTKEELKMRNESRKILHCPDLRVSATCVRVPVMRSHSEALTIETERPLSPDEARALLSDAKGVKLVDAPAEKAYPMPLFASDQDLIHVGRVRRDESAEDPSRALTLWVCGDQIRKGAATNAVQIAEIVWREKAKTRGLIEDPSTP